MLDKLPPWLRHLLIVVGATALGTIAETIVASGGVSHVNWVDTLRQAVDTGFVAGATVSLALWLTPLTRQYGVGTPRPEAADRFDVFPDEVTPDK